MAEVTSIWNPKAIPAECFSAPFESGSAMSWKAASLLFWQVRSDNLKKMNLTAGNPQTAVINTSKLAFKSVWGWYFLRRSSSSWKNPGEDKHLIAFREFSDSAAIPSKSNLEGEVDIRDDIKKIQMSGLQQPFAMSYWYGFFPWHVTMPGFVHSRMYRRCDSG